MFDNARDAKGWLDCLLLVVRPNSGSAGKPELVPQVSTLPSLVLLQIQNDHLIEQLVLDKTKRLRDS